MEMFEFSAKAETSNGQKAEAPAGLFIIVMRRVTSAGLEPCQSRRAFLIRDLIYENYVK